MLSLMQSLATVGSKAHGRAGQHMASGFVVATQIMMCLVLQLAAATSLQHALKGAVSTAGISAATAADGMLSLWLAQLAVGGVLVVAAQLRYLAQISWLCYVGNMAQLVAACLLAVGLLSDARSSSSSSSSSSSNRGQQATEEQHWLHQVVTLLGVVFAYGGQYAYVDIAHQMSSRKSFATVQHDSVSIMTVLYLLFGTMVYALRGQAASTLEVFAVHGSPGLSRAVVVCILVQTVVQQVISVHILTSTFVAWYPRCKQLVGAVARFLCPPARQLQAAPSNSVFSTPGVPDGSSTSRSMCTCTILGTNCDADGACHLALAGCATSAAGTAAGQGARRCKPCTSILSAAQCAQHQQQKGQRCVC
jgi:hypothetical protein